MPLTDFQREVLSAIVANRSEASHFAGGLVLNATAESPRFSKDFDFFHDAVEALAEASERDAATLRSAGYEVIPDESYGSWDTPTSFRRAKVRRNDDEMTLDWAHDTAWRFFAGIRLCASTGSACAGRGHHRRIRSWKAIVDLRRDRPYARRENSCPRPPPP